MLPAFWNGPDFVSAYLSSLYEMNRVGVSKPPYPNRREGFGVDTLGRREPPLVPQNLFTRMPPYVIYAPAGSNGHILGQEVRNFPSVGKKDDRPALKTYRRWFSGLAYRTARMRCRLVSWILLFGTVLWLVLGGGTNLRQAVGFPLWAIEAFSSTTVSVKPHPAIARIIAAEGNVFSMGSGTLVADTGSYALVLTNWHVIRDARGQVEVAFPSGQKVPAVVVAADPVWDLALLMTPSVGIPPIGIADRIPTPGERLIIAGYGRGNYRAASGRCVQYVAPGFSHPAEMLEVSVGARQGDSGGPILNTRGELAGVLFGTTGGRTIGSHSGRVRHFLAAAQPRLTTAHAQLAALMARSEGDSLASARRLSGEGACPAREAVSPAAFVRSAEATDAGRSQTTLTGGNSSIESAALYDPLAANPVSSILDTEEYIPPSNKGLAPSPNSPAWRGSMAEQLPAAQVASHPRATGSTSGLPTGHAGSVSVPASASASPRSTPFVSAESDPYAAEYSSFAGSNVGLGTSEGSRFTSRPPHNTSPGADRYARGSAASLKNASEPDQYSGSVDSISPWTGDTSASTTYGHSEGVSRLSGAAGASTGSVELGSRRSPWETGHLSSAGGDGAKRPSAGVTDFSSPGTTGALSSGSVSAGNSHSNRESLTLGVHEPGTFRGSPQVNGTAAGRPPGEVASSGIFSGRDRRSGTTTHGSSALPQGGGSSNLARSFPSGAGDEGFNTDYDEEGYGSWGDSDFAGASGNSGRNYGGRTWEFKGDEERPMTFSSSASRSGQAMSSSGFWGGNSSLGAGVPQGGQGSEGESGGNYFRPGPSSGPSGGGPDWSGGQSSKSLSESVWAREGLSSGSGDESAGDLSQSAESAGYPPSSSSVAPTFPKSAFSSGESLGPQADEVPEPFNLVSGLLYEVLAILSISGLTLYVLRVVGPRSRRRAYYYRRRRYATYVPTYWEP